MHVLTPRLPSFLFLLCLLLPTDALFCQEAATGAIEGRVFNQRTGRYVSRAQVTLEDLGREVFTNAFGEYRFYGVPVGERSIRVFYTGLQAEQARVRVLPGETTTRDLRLGARTAEEGVYELEEFVVDGRDFQSMAELAIQEERFSVNMKNVVSADAYGMVAQGNIGEFVKFIPGVIVNYGGTYASGADAANISVRGFGADKTAVTIDGVPISNAQPGSLSRTIGLDMMSINNAARVEVIKVPTPDQPSASIGGTVNLVSKTAFEYPEPTLSYRVYFSMNSENLSWNKTPGPVNKKTYKVLPGFDLSYALPLNEKFGLTFTLASANTFNENHYADIDYEIRASQSIPAYVGMDGERIEPVYADVAHPVLNNLGITDKPRTSNRHSGSIKLDYRPWEGHLITLAYQGSVFESRDAQRRFEMSTGGVYGVREYGPDFMTSRPGWGLAETNVTALDREGMTNTGYVKWSYIKGPWDARTHFSYSVSDGEYISAKNSHFSEIQLERRNIPFAGFYDIVEGIPQRYEYLDEDGKEIDTTRLEAYNVAGYIGEDPESSQLRVLAGESLSKSEILTAKFDVRRDFDFLPLEFMNLALKVGAYIEERLEEKWGKGTTYGYQYVGGSGVRLDVREIRDDVYRDVRPGFGFAPREWPDVYKLYQFFEDNPGAFDAAYDVSGFDALGRIEPTVAAENWTSYVNTNKAVTETSFSHYYQLEADFFNNRLSLIGGLRQEISRREGRSPYRDHDWRYLRRPVDENGDGFLDVLVLDQYGSLDVTSPMKDGIARLYEAEGAVYADGQPFRVEDVGLHDIPPRSFDNRGQWVEETLYGYIIPGSLRARQLEYIPNYEIDEESKGKPSPVVSALYDLTEQISLRLSWSRTYAKPDFEGAYGVLQRVEYDRNEFGSGGTIKIGNPGLEPWTSNNWDFGVSYYTESGGKLTAVYYTKSIKDFHQRITVGPEDPRYEGIMDSIGLGSNSTFAQEGWLVETAVNGEGTAKTYGYEFEIAQSLSILGEWGKYFYLTGSYTTKRESGNQDSLDQIGTTSDDFAAAGIVFDYKRFSARLNATWRSESIRGTGTNYLWPDPSIGPPEDADLTEYLVETYRYEPAEWKVDLNLAYRFSDRFILDFSARNITNTAQNTYFRSVGDEYPEYAQVLARETFGVQFTTGFSGTF